jgi:hypothetical protein
VFGEVVDPRRQQGDLNLGRSSVFAVEAVLFDDGLLLDHAMS